MFEHRHDGPARRVVAERVGHRTVGQRRDTAYIELLCFDAHGVGAHGRHEAGGDGGGKALGHAHPEPAGQALDDEQHIALVQLRYGGPVHPRPDPEIDVLPLHERHDRLRRVRFGALLLRCR